VLDLAAFGRRTALRTPDGPVSYAELAQRVGDLSSDVLGGTRRLVLVEGANRVEALVAYLAALEHGHVALLVPEGRTAQREQLVAAYDPDVVFGTGAAGWTATVRREHTAHDLHPDLALLLSTSGSTGSPKLVRLSAANVRSNALSIGQALSLRRDDRAMTSLPMHYCYGLSVVNSHLACGAGLVMTEGSVVDECFWDRFLAEGATSFAGVPYTFDLLDRSGFERRELPTLRSVTQAGGRLAPDRVRAYAELGRRRGWALVVMYGQTEATARMAVLPPALAATRPAAVGPAVPGGSFRLEPVADSPEPGTGELVYSGPNVMLGYAEQPADLARGAEVAELRTGDLARCVDGLYEIVGRRSRHAKLFGLRIDLDRVEACSSTPGVSVRVVVVDEVLHAFTTGRRSAAVLNERISRLCGLPPGVVRVTEIERLPRTATGKPDHAALEGQARLLVAQDAQAREASTRRPTTAASVRDDLALVLGRPDATLDDSFVDLGGDSLSYVELATRLGARLGQLPPGWHLLSPVRLVAGVPDADPPVAGRRRPGTPMDITVAVRALAIVAVVGSHANLLDLAGGAHLLLAVAGFNLARFQLAGLPRRQRVRNALGSLVRFAVPSALFIGIAGAVTGGYAPATALFLNGLVGSDTWTPDWQFWFLEALVWASLSAVALIAVPAIDRLERRTPYAFALGLLVAGLAVRFAWTGIETGATERYTPGLVLWLVAAGWAAARATTAWQRALLLALAAVGTVGYFGDPQRELLVLSGLALLVWIPTVRLPRQLAAGCAILAGASLSIYLTHWQVYPHLEASYPLLATGLSLLVGIAYTRATRPAMRVLGRLTHAALHRDP
jgi:acyl-CoA synthetase (AMP-forming)/AMP-acid ligase II